MKKKLFGFFAVVVFSTNLFSYFLGQKVPANFNYNYWNKNASFNSYLDIQDSWLCSIENSDKCNCDITDQNPQCLVFNEDLNTSVKINETLKKEKYNALSIYDINDTFSVVDDFNGYNKDKSDVNNVGTHPLYTKQGEYIIFRDREVTKATEQEIQDLDDFLLAMSDPETLVGEDVGYDGDFQDEYVNDATTDASTLAEDATPDQNTSSNIATAVGSDPDEMNSIQDTILAMGENLYYETNGEHSFMSDGGEVDFENVLDTDFLSNYVDDSAGSNKLLGELGLGGSINCYAKTNLPKLKPVNMQMCVKKDGAMEKNDYSYELSGGFNAETVGKPVCKLKGEFVYNLSDETCSGCDDPEKILDIKNNVCYSCKEDEIYDSELIQCVNKVFSYKKIAEATDGGNTYHHFWVARCYKKSWASTIVYTGDKEVEPPGDTQCARYAKTTSACITDSGDECVWGLYNPRYKKQYLKDVGVDDNDIDSWNVDLNDYLKFNAPKTPNPYKDTKGVLDYRLNMYTENALWGKKERKKQYNYGAPPFYRKYTNIIPMPYKPEVEKHGWEFLRSLKSEGSSVFSRWKELTVDWERGDVKYASYLKFEGTDIRERMFACKGSKFYWWSNNSTNTGDEVGYLNINTCEMEAPFGWNSAFDNSPTDIHSSVYTMGNVLEEGENIIKFGIYNPDNDKDIEAGKATLTYAYRARRTPDKHPIVVSDIEWKDSDVGIGCKVDVSTPPFPEVCVTLKSSADIYKDPKVRKVTIGKNVNMTPAQNITANFSDAVSTLSSSYIAKEDNDNMFYPSGISINTLNDATDIKAIFSNEKLANSFVGNAILKDDYEELALIKSYMKTDQARKNSYFLGAPNKKTVVKELVKIRPDYLGLPKNSSKKDEAIATISKELSDDYNILNFSQNTMIFFFAQFNESESIPEIKKVSEVEEMEQKIFKKFVESNSTLEAKAIIEKKNAERFVAVQTATNGNRIATPTLQRIKSLTFKERLPYVALSEKQMLKDAYVASVFSRIGKFKTEIFDYSIDAARINAKPVYGKIMSNSLNNAVKWSEDKIR